MVLSFKIKIKKAKSQKPKDESLISSSYHFNSIPKKNTVLSDEEIKKNEKGPRTPSIHVCTLNPSYTLNISHNIHELGGTTIELWEK